VAVVGDLGSGKSLLAALMLQLKQVTGLVKNYSTFGYVPQDPWIINATIRDNIVFGEDVDLKKYNETIRLCGMTRDIMVLSNGNLFSSDQNRR
jgi:ABC-type multidrug transport system fused ATPase/permease subunit